MTLKISDLGQASSFYASSFAQVLSKAAGGHVKPGKKKRARRAHQEQALPVKTPVPYRADDYIQSGHTLCFLVDRGLIKMVAALKTEN
jgi:hypothetical protein